MRRSPDNQNCQTIAFYAGESTRRVQCLSQIPEVEVVAVGGVEEPDIREVHDIAKFKTDSARSQLNGTFSSPENGKRKILLAVDARTEISVINQDNKVVFSSRRKPKKPLEVLNNFKEMLQVALIFGFANYRVVSASLYDGKPQKNSETIQSLISLSKQSLVYLTSPEGFAAYLRTFNYLHSLSPHTDSRSKKTTVENIFAGISLSVLSSMGLVESIDGVPFIEGDDKTNESLRCALLTVACGFGTNVLKMVHPEALENILKWPWLKEEAERTLFLSNKSKENSN